MKKLESLRNLKFQINEAEARAIKGGSGTEYSYEYSVTRTSGGDKTDVNTYDMCVPSPGTVTLQGLQF